MFKILNDIKLSPEGPSEDDVLKKFLGSFEQTFKMLWADHGDNLSLAYSGTGALKCDFTRTGKKTIKGSIYDGYLSLKRLYINNFRDGYNQDCHDYFLGVLNPKRNKFKSHSFLMLQITLPCVFFISVFIHNI